MARARWTGILTFLVGVATLVALFRFNEANAYGEHYLVVNVICLFWIPMTAVFLLAREEPSRFGFTSGESRGVWLWTLLLYGGALVFLIPASRKPGFQLYYPMDKTAADSIAAFAYSAAKWGVYFFCWEFFFRGFLLFGLQRSIGWAAVVVQAIAFGMMHYGKLTPEFAASFPAGLILGLLALRARSFFPCFVLHWVSALTFDLLVIWAQRQSM